MQRPSEQPATVALVGVSAASGGAALAYSDGAAFEPGVVLSFVCLTSAAVAVMRRTAARQERRMRSLFTDLSRQQDEREQQLAKREERATLYEESVHRQSQTADLRVRSAYGRIDQLNAECREERERRIQVEVEYGELAREYNEVLLETAQVDLPSPTRSPRRVAVGQTNEERGPRRHPERRGPLPSLSVVDTPREHQESV
ncbi:hypothetical protein [Streptomyces sp. Root369]|uniref:hypothetical protein n=1 Tax=Streptomyces sp. Root369 TaxID=1736523 RepID=UPI00070ED95B|nr:hypothetical protein [Streptomyces sp. Root369]KQW13598.1 hypothetical protein ASD08_31025 [Streptomyces sp. Root369]